MANQLNGRATITAKDTRTCGLNWIFGPDAELGMQPLWGNCTNYAQSFLKTVGLQACTTKLRVTSPHWWEPWFELTLKHFNALTILHQNSITIQMDRTSQLLAAQ